MALCCCFLTCYYDLISYCNSYMLKWAYLEFYYHSCEVCIGFASFSLAQFQNCRGLWSVMLLFICASTSRSCSSKCVSKRSNDLFRFIKKKNQRNSVSSLDLNLSTSVSIVVSVELKHVFKVKHVLLKCCLILVRVFSARSKFLLADMKHTVS